MVGRAVTEHWGMVTGYHVGGGGDGGSGCLNALLPRGKRALPIRSQLHQGQSSSNRRYCCPPRGTR